MEVSCPVSAERVNENVVRIIAFMVAIIAVCCIISANYWAIVFLIVDFAARAFTTGKLSLLKYLALKITKVLAIPQRMTDLAPKKFAATMGFVFCLLITAMVLMNFATLALILTLTMTFFALLESIFAICVGCHVYSFLQFLRKAN
ncbi:DUF4395 domain-containing protein [Pedobacter sp. GSP4]|uniref:DUF4395 domain-containing protein n=1 Tax=Pedobacter sp. GSP4 TaxID=3453716 RepID=UPI003EEFDD23